MQTAFKIKCFLACIVRVQRTFFKKGQRAEERSLLSQTLPLFTLVWRQPVQFPPWSVCDDQVDDLVSTHESPRVNYWRGWGANSDSNVSPSDSWTYKNKKESTPQKEENSLFPPEPVRTISQKRIPPECSSSAFPRHYGATSGNFTSRDLQLRDLRSRDRSSAGASA